MKLYHASPVRFDSIKRSQAVADESLEVPVGELQNKIYLTGDLGFALAMAARPNGITSVDNSKISFEHYDEFDPEKSVYVYEVDSETIPAELLEQIDSEQFAADVDELIPAEVKEYKAKDVFNHYEWTEWKHPDEVVEEVKKEFKFQ